MKQRSVWRQNITPPNWVNLSVSSDKEGIAYYCAPLRLQFKLVGKHKLGAHTAMTEPLVASSSQLHQKHPGSNQDEYQNLILWDEKCMENSFVFFFGPNYCISLLWKSINKRRWSVVQVFFSHLFSISYIWQNVSFLLHYIMTNIRSFLMSMEEWIYHTANQQCTHACATWPRGCPGSGSSCWQKVKTHFDLVILRQACSMLKTTVMASELCSIRKWIDTMLYVSHSTKQMLGPIHMQWSSRLQSLNQA